MQGRRTCRRWEWQKKTLTKQQGGDWWQEPKEEYKKNWPAHTTTSTFALLPQRRRHGRQRREKIEASLQQRLGRPCVTWLRVIRDYLSRSLLRSPWNLQSLLNATIDLPPTVYWGSLFCGLLWSNRYSLKSSRTNTTLKSLASQKSKPNSKQHSPGYFVSPFFCSAP